MSTVYFCSSTNSTFFTTCCHVAICDDESMCPMCKEEILPRSHRGRWDVAMNAFYGRDEVVKMRKAALSHYKIQEKNENY